MPYYQVDDQLPQNQKVRVLLESAADGDLEGAAALSAWTLSGAQCQASLTDGQVKRTDLIRHYLNPDLADRLARRLVAVGLWHSAEHDCSQCPPVTDPKGWVFHDWFQAKYDTGVQVKESRRKRQELKDQGLLNAVWARDCIDPSNPTTAKCRYCGFVVKRSDRKSPKRPMLDHVDPIVARGVRNLVIACAECNQTKGRRTPAQAGMQLQPPPRATVDDPTSSLLDRRASPPPSGDAGRPADGTSDVGSDSPPSGAAETPQEAVMEREEGAEQPPPDQIQDQSDPDLIDGGLVRMHERGRLAGSGRVVPQGESHQGEAGQAAPAPRRSRRRRSRGGRGKKPSTSPTTQPSQDQDTPPAQEQPAPWDAGDFPVEDPPGQFGSPWAGWRGQPPADDEAYCEAHGQHHPCRMCQDGVG